MATPGSPHRATRAPIFVLLATLAAGLLVGFGCSGRTVPVTSGPTSSGGSTAPNPPPAAPAPPDSAPPLPPPTRGAAVDFAKTAPTTPHGR